MTCHKMTKSNLSARGLSAVFSSYIDHADHQSRFRFEVGLLDRELASYQAWAGGSDGMSRFFFAIFYKSLKVSTTVPIKFKILLNVSDTVGIFPRLTDPIR